MHFQAVHLHLEVATEPPMDVFVTKLIRPYCLAWRGSNKAVSLSVNRRRSDSLTQCSSTFVMPWCIL